MRDLRTPVLRLLFAFTISIAFAGVAYSQYDYDTVEVVEQDPIYPEDSLKVKATYPGGWAAMDRYIESHVEYHDRAYKLAKSGTVIIGFVVEKDGDLTNIKSLHRRRVGYGVEEAIMKVLDEMPLWKPALIDGKPVRMSGQIELPLSF
jgi:protein TonB